MHQGMPPPHTQESDGLIGAGARGCILAYFDSHTQLESWPASQPASRVDQVFREGLSGGYLRLPRGREGASLGLCGQRAPGRGTARAKALRWAGTWYADIRKERP